MIPWATSDDVTAASSGDEAAIEGLITTIWPKCFRLAASIIGDTHLAQDAAQESCAIIHRRVRGLRDPQAFTAWAYRIVARESLRSRGRASADSSARSTTLGASNDGTTTIDVWRALDALPRGLREVVVLFYFDELTSREIASTLNVAHATVRTRLARAREHLRRLLDDYEIERIPATEGLSHHAI
ncbi:MAG TPA: RNA polymerase sigma factor [Candidatus Eremiobacteraceae bacterium]|nr:RNA polymerase sigma factor [Candidatus Eremiobacteraceae bacterium]